MTDRSSSAPLIRIAGLAKRFGPVAAVDDVSLEIGAGECLCLLGPSGCGKSTLLRLIAGLERPEAGRIELDGRDITALPAYRRPVNTMFQSYALFPHLTIAGNVAYGLRRERLRRAEIAARVDEMLRLLRLEGLGARSPAQLSGGQRARVALARALGKRPRVLLLDEPLAALDRRLREATQTELKALQARLGLTMVVVTHDQEEAMIMADRIGVMEAGRLAQVGTPREIYDRPRTRFVASFIGDVNLLPGAVLGREAGLWRIASPAAERPFAVVAAPDDPAFAPGAAVAVAVRPERITLGAAAANVLGGRVAALHDRGGTTDARVLLSDGATIRWLRVRTGPASADRGAPEPSLGEAVRLGFAPEAAVVLPA
jgi:putrescine transport system ATP-binding protein